MNNTEWETFIPLRSEFFFCNIPEWYHTDLELKLTAIRYGRFSSFLHHEMEPSVGNILVFLIVLLKGLSMDVRLKENKQGAQNPSVSYTEAVVVGQKQVENSLLSVLNYIVSNPCESHQKP